MTEIIGFLWRDESPWVLAATALLAIVVWRFLATGRVTLRHTLLFWAFWLLVDVAAALFFAAGERSIAGGLHQAALLGLGLVLIRLSGLAFFRLVLPLFNVRPPRIVEDIVVIGGYVLWGMVRLSYAGVELSGLVATSAVITAVLAFAMQDTLGNILGGLALQLDNSLEIGDWVRVDDLSGRVIEIQWRYTAILTRNGEKVVVPNSQLMKGKFAVLADRDAGVAGWRRWVWFNVDYSVAPGQVIATIEEALASAEIDNVARSPAASCVVMDFVPGSVRYAVRYWLVDPQDDDPTDSRVRIHVLAALQRSGWRIALPDQVVHLVEESEAHRAEVRAREQARREQALASVRLFSMLSAEERARMARHLAYAPFARGDVLTRQGAVAHWLYIIVSGEAEVYWETPTGERQLIRRLPTGSIFGEMGLMTGAPRAASVIAATDIECYRLDKAGFEEIIQARPDLAESMSHILVERVQELEGMQQQYHRDRPPTRAERHADIVARVRAFFGLG